MNLSFKNQTILITGGTRGIGKQLVNDLSSLNANLLITGTNENEIISLNNQSLEKKENKIFYCLNMLDSESVEKFIGDIKKVENIDCVVNNAGINRLNYIQKSNDKDWDDMIKVNLTFPYKLVRNLSKKMIKNKYGRIVNIASIFSKVSREKRSIYTSTKFGIHGLTVGSSNDLSRFNILVNTVSPGFVLTDLTKKNLSKSERDNLEKIIPIRRLAKTKDISSIVLFLLSNLNTYITGQNIIVDGGFTNV